MLDLRPTCEHCNKALPPASPDALAWIMYTSSSTGPPKGVMQTRANVFTYAGQVIDGLALGPADRMLLASPLNVHAGATLSLAALLSGASLTPVDLRRTGRGTKPPPQFGQTLPSTASTQAAQNVHSKLQMNAPGASAGNSVPHRSQSGRISSIRRPPAQPLRRCWRPPLRLCPHRRLRP